VSRSRFGPMAALVLAALATVSLAGNAAAATVLSSSGQIGNYVLQDNHDQTRGVDCFYETHQETHHGSPGYWLDKLSVRGPQVYAWDNGSGSKQWVGWRFQVQNEDTSASDAWTTVFTSTLTKAKVGISNGYQFARRTWTAPENLANNKNYRVMITVKWYQRGGSSHVQGTLKARYDYYHVKGGGATIPPTIRQTDCYVSN
jgi:hypothetical protein